MTIMEDVEEMVVLAAEILDAKPKGNYEIVIMYRDPDIDPSWQTKTYRDVSIADIQSLDEIANNMEIGGMSVKKIR
jgi:hypothetical protein